MQKTQRAPSLFTLSREVLIAGAFICGSVLVFWPVGVQVLADHSLRCETFRGDIPGKTERKLSVCSVTAIAFSLNGRTIATADNKMSFDTPQNPLGQTAINLWDLNGHLILAFDQNPTKGVWNRVNALAFSPDGRILASDVSSVPGDNPFFPKRSSRVLLWDAQSGSLLRTIEGAHANFINAIVFSPDGQMIATASDDKTVKVWDVATGMQLRELRDARRVTSVTFSNKGETIASGNADGTIQEWNLKTGAELRTFGRTGSYPLISLTDVAGSLVSLASDGTIQRLGSAFGQDEFRCSRLVNNEVAGMAAALASDGKLVARAEEKGMVSVCNADSGRIQYLESFMETAAIAFSPKDRKIAVGSGDDLLVWLIPYDN